ncbi:MULTISPECIES: entericidin A/B family lipoprotein [Acinetobacter]|nr:entericidin A/B family lipoprotein [Acinetobacter sp. SM1B]RAZ05895.1 entericidin [Acinetobacter sp. SM1B]
MKKILATSLILAFVLTGCNTVKGVGKDVSKAGEAVTGTAEKTSDKIHRN